MVLDDILAHKFKEVAQLKQNRSLAQIERAAREHRIPKRPLERKLAVPGTCHLICELKQASPSEGRLRTRFDPVALARTFEAAGASAISVLTENKYFQGSADIPRQVRAQTTVPILRKDFIVDPYQIYETVLIEADAYLLIAMLLNDVQLRTFLRLGRELALDPLVEVHSEDELNRSLDAGATLIGINTRNLRTLEVDRSVPGQLLAHVPSGVTAVIESGIASAQDIRAFRALGARCFLVGTALMKSKQISQTIGELRNALR